MSPIPLEDLLPAVKMALATAPKAVVIEPISAPLASQSKEHTSPGPLPLS
jgi:hypothetical protein